MKPKVIKVIIKRPYQKAEVCEIKNDLTTFQNIVGGCIERVTLPASEYIDVYVHEEGKLLHLDGNFLMPEYEDAVCGTAVLCTFNAYGNAVGLTEGQIKTALEYIERYALKNGENIWRDYTVLKIEAMIKMREGVRK